jgi:4-amino-4-deoxy-L-arabinose transferase-like glycosyltransferase
MIRVFFALLAIACGIGAALTFNMPGPASFVLVFFGLGFGLLATMLSYRKEDPDETDYI